jgi:hypothetical protein
MVGLAFVAGCANDPVRTDESTNKDVPVSLLFEHDGCKMYRFLDDGRYVYYAKCGGSSETSWNQMEGKINVPHQVQTEVVTK